MEGIAQHDLRTELLQFFRVHGLDAAIGTHRHEGGSLDLAMDKGEAAAACRSVGVEEVEFHRPILATGLRKPRFGLKANQSFRLQLRSLDQHGIAVAEEAVLVSHGVGIGATDGRHAGEG